MTKPEFQDDRGKRLPELVCSSRSLCLCLSLSWSLSVSLHSPTPSFFSSKKDLEGHLNKRPMCCLSCDFSHSCSNHFWETGQEEESWRGEGGGLFYECTEWSLFCAFQTHVMRLAWGKAHCFFSCFRLSCPHLAMKSWLNIFPKHKPYLLLMYVIVQVRLAMTTFDRR